MKCPTKIDLLEHLINDFQAEQDKAAIQEHAEACADCRQRLQALEQEMKNILQENEQECEMVQDHLLDYLDDKINAVAGIDFKRHLAKCERCRFLAQQLKIDLSWDEFMALDYPVPETLIRKLEQLLIEAINKPLPSLPEETYWDKIGEFIDRIVITIVSAPEPAFLGNVVTGEAQVEIRKRSLALELGQSGKVVKIVSLDDIELGRQISDQRGRVIFTDFEPGKYKIMVEGFEIKEVRPAPPP